MTKPNIKQICRHYGVTQAELARRFKIPLRTVQQWYAGDRKPPDYVVAMIQKILEMENTPPHQQ